MRKDLPFILLPNKRTLFDVSQTSDIPPDCSFNDKTTAPHCNVWNKFAEVLSKIDYNEVFQEKRKIFKLIMALHMNEINIFARHVFRNNSFVGSPLND